MLIDRHSLEFLFYISDYKETNDDIVSELETLIQSRFYWIISNYSEVDFSYYKHQYFIHMTEYFINKTAHINTDCRKNIHDYIIWYALNIINSDGKVKTVQDLLVNCINKQKMKEYNNDIWEKSAYKDLVKLQNNNIGIVGEEFIHLICRECGIESEFSGVKNRHKGFDGIIIDKKVEVKTAHKGSRNDNFQHELSEEPWKGSDYMIFIDIAPSCIYLTIFKNFDEETYKCRKSLYCFPTKKITWRKEKGSFKLDTTVKINEKNVVIGHTIKISENIEIQKLRLFILKNINKWRM